MALFLVVLKSWAAWKTGSVAMLGSLADTGLDLVASIVGDLPDDVQQVTEFSAAAVAGSAHQAEARNFLAYLASPKNAAVIRDTGLVPRTGGK